MLHVQEVARAVNRAFLDLSEPHAADVGHLDPQRLSIGAAHPEDRPGDDGGVFSAKRPSAEGR